VEGTLVAFSKRYYLFQGHIVISQVPAFHETTRAFKWRNSYYFSNYMELIFLSVVLLLNFMFISYKMFLLTLCRKNYLDLSHNRVCISIIFSLFRISVSNFFTCQEKFSFLIPDRSTNIFINFFYVTVISNYLLFCISLCRSYKF